MLCVIAPDSSEPIGEIIVVQVRLRVVEIALRSSGRIGGTTTRLKVLGQLSAAPEIHHFHSSEMHRLNFETLCYCRLNHKALGLSIVDQPGVRRLALSMNPHSGCSAPSWTFSSNVIPVSS